MRRICPSKNAGKIILLASRQHSTTLSTAIPDCLVAYRLYCLSLSLYIYVLHLFLAQLPYLPWLQCRALLANHLGSTGDPCSVVYSTSGLDWVSLSCSPHRNECSHPCTVDSRHSRLSRLVRCNESEVLRIRSAVVLVLPLIRFGPGEEGFGVLWTCGFDVQ